MELKIEYGLEHGVSEESKKLLDTALAYMFETELGIRLGRLTSEWRVADCGGPRVEFDTTSLDAKVGIFGTAVIEDGCLKGFTGAYGTPPLSEHKTNGFRLKIPPMSVLWILAAAKAAEPPKTAPEPLPDAEFDVPDSVLEDALACHEDMFDFPYELKSPGQMDFFMNNLVACMERTIMERMDFQDKFIDRIALPEDVCPGFSAIYLDSKIFGDTLFVEETSVTNLCENIRFSQLGVDAAAAITRYVMEHYPKQPLFK